MEIGKQAFIKYIYICTLWNFKSVPLEEKNAILSATN